MGVRRSSKLTSVYARNPQESAADKDCVTIGLTARRHGVDLSMSVARLAAYAGLYDDVERR